MAIYVVSINQQKWEKFYPASLNKGKKWSWGRLDTGIFDDDELTELSANSICVLLYVVLRSAKHQRATEIPVSEKKVCDRFNISSEQLATTFEWFENRGFLKAERTSEPLVGGESLDSPPIVPQKSPESDSSAPNPSLASDFRVPNEGPYVRTHDTIRNEEPPNPLSGGGGDKNNLPKPKPGRKDVDRAVVKTVALAVAGVLRLATEDEIRKEIGDTGLKLLSHRFNNWAAFCACYKREWQSGYHERFKRDVERDLKAVAYELLGISKPPELMLVAGSMSAMDLSGGAGISFDVEGSQWPN